MQSNPLREPAFFLAGVACAAAAIVGFRRAPGTTPMNGSTEELSEVSSTLNNVLRAQKTLEDTVKSESAHLSAVGEQIRSVVARLEKVEQQLAGQSSEEGSKAPGDNTVKAIDRLLEHKLKSFDERMAAQMNAANGLKAVLTETQKMLEDLVANPPERRTAAAPPRPRIVGPTG